MAQSPSSDNRSTLSEPILAARAKGRMVDLEGSKQAALLGLPAWRARSWSRASPDAAKASLAHLVEASASAPGSGVDAQRAGVLGGMGQAFLSLMSTGVSGWDRHPAAGAAAEALLAGLPLWAQRAALGEALAGAVRRSDAATADWALTRGAPLAPEHGSEAERASAAMGGLGENELSYAILQHDFLSMAACHSWPAMAMASAAPEAAMLDVLASHGIFDGAYFATLAAGASASLARCSRWVVDARKLLEELEESATEGDKDDISMGRRQLGYHKHIAEEWSEARQGILCLHPWSLFPDPPGVARWAPSDAALSSETIGARLMRVLQGKSSSAARLAAAEHAIARGWMMPEPDKLAAASTIAESLVAEADKLGDKSYEGRFPLGATSESEARVAQKMKPAELAVESLVRTLLPAWPSAALDVLNALAQLAECDARNFSWHDSRSGALDAFARWIPLAESMGAIIDLGASASPLAKMAALDANAKLIADMGARGAIFTSAQSADILISCAERGFASCLKAALGAGMAHGQEAIRPQSYSKISPLFAAAEHGHFDCLELLLASGASWRPDSPKKHTALDFAAANGHDQCAAALFKHGAKARQQPMAASSPDNIKPKTSLALACSGGHIGCVNILLDAGALIDELDADGFTALARASQSGALESIQTLLERGARMDIECSAGATPAAIAAHFRLPPALVAEIAAACLAAHERTVMNEAAKAPSAPSRKIGRI